MLQAFVVTLREGVEAALIVGITLAYLDKIGRSRLRKSVYAALAAAFVASIGVAALLARAQWNQDVFEGWIMIAAAFFVISMIVFMMKTGRKLKGEIEGKVGVLASEGSWVGLFFFVFLLVLREGVETALILGAVALNTSALLNFVGTLLGIVTAVVFGVMFIKGSVRINLQKFFRITTVILFFVAAQLVVSGLHELSENGVLPSSRQEMAIIGPIVSNNLFFFITILALAGLMVLLEMKRREPVPTPSSAAERRKALWTSRRERLWMVSVYASCFLFIVMVTAEFIYTKSVSALSPATEVSLVNGKLSVPLEQLYDGDLHRFQTLENGREVRFFIYQKPDGKLATAFDACEICGPVGFYKTSSGLVCKNCAAPVNPQSVGMAGGCNPIPLPSTRVGNALVIREADLATHSQIFDKR